MSGDWVLSAVSVGIGVVYALTAVCAVMLVVNVIRDRSGPPDLPHSSR
jgi:hypothetical protein